MSVSLNRRDWMLGTTAALLSGAASAKDASNWPNRPVKVIVPGGAGAILDSLARQLYSRLETALGQPFVIDNRPGANGLIGSTTVKNAAPDGYTILHSTASSMVMSGAETAKDMIA